MKKSFICQSILLAAGSGKRFDPSGQHNKLLARLPSGVSVAASCAQHLLAVTPLCLAVLPALPTMPTPIQTELSAQLSELGCTITFLLDDATSPSMARSLKHGLLQTDASDAWIIALADMPSIRPESIRRLVDALQAGADIAVLSYQGRRGHPVGFSRLHLPELLQLNGDQGARALLARHPVIEIAVDDPGILLDIDTVDDLRFS